jgi:hypothetical protein
MPLSRGKERDGEIGDGGAMTVTDRENVGGMAKAQLGAGDEGDDFGGVWSAHDAPAARNGS